MFIKNLKKISVCFSVLFLVLFNFAFTYPENLKGVYYVRVLLIESSDPVVLYLADSADLSFSVENQSVINTSQKVASFYGFPRPGSTESTEVILHFEPYSQPYYFSDVNIREYVSFAEIVDYNLPMNDSTSFSSFQWSVIGLLILMAIFSFTR